MFINLTICLLVAAVTLWTWWRKKHFSFFKDLGIPGPPPSFFFGNFRQLQEEGPLVCHTKWIKTYGKIVGFYLGLRPMVIVADPELLKQMQVKESHVYVNRPNLFDFGVGTRRPAFSHQLIALKGQRWREVRKMITPAFTSGKIKAMTPSVADSVDLFMKDIEKHNGEVFDIMPKLQSLTLDVIGKTALGLQSDIIGNADHPLLKVVRMIFRSRLQSLMFRYLLSFSELSIFTFLGIKLAFMIRDSGISPMTSMLATLSDVIKDRRKDPALRRPDLLQGLIDAVGDLDSISDSQLTASLEENDKAEKETEPSRKSVKLTNEEVLANALLILLAGYETTSTMLSFVIYFLINHQDVQDRLRKELNEALETEGEIGYSFVQKLPYMDQVMNETMRMCPPIYNFILRESTEETTLGGYTFPKETAFLVPVHHLQNSSENFQNPDKFDPERFAPSRKGEFDPIVWQPFGYGPRNCVGMRFAIMEAKVALAKLLLKYRLESASGQIIEGVPEKSFSVAIMCPKDGVNVRAVKLF